MLRSEFNHNPLVPSPNRPRTVPSIEADTIPVELRSRDQWVVWRRRNRDGKSTKVPYQSLIPDRGAETDDPSTWSSFADAIIASANLKHRIDGVGFVFSADDPYCGIDLDKCLSPDGKLNAWAAEVLAELPGYAEISPSGSGLKLFLQASVPGGKGRKLLRLGPDEEGALECYDRTRYFTTTGKLFDHNHTSIVDAQAILDRLHAKWFPPPITRERIKPEPTTILADVEVIRKANASKDGLRFAALFSGSTEGYPSKSEADLALASKLAFWVGGDVDAIDRLFRQSGLLDSKWSERTDYREMTITKAVNRTSFYDPRHRTNYGHNPPPANPVEGDDPPAPDPSREGPEDPHRLARTYLESTCSHADGLTIRYWNEEWHRWEGKAWRPCPDREVSAELTGHIKTEFDRIAYEQSDRPKSVTTKSVGNTLQALRHLALLSTRQVARQPHWLPPFEPGEDLPDPVEILPTANVLVHLPSFAAGERCSIRPTPRFFSPNSLGYDFDPSMPDPREWLGFLTGLWPEDPDSIDSLQEWFGYLLVPDTGQQKILMVIGPKRSGKGTIARVLRALVGPSNVAAPTLSGLATNFGLAPLIGKPVALISDARLSGRADTQVIVERLLSISGEDAQTIDRKHLTSWTGSLSTRFVLVSNELPRLGDASGALPSRMILLKLDRSFYGHEDTTLTDRLLKELPSILLWAVRGWIRLKERGYFLQAPSGRELLDDLEELASPVSAFLAAACDTGPDHEIEIQTLFSAWKKWCEINGRDHPGDVAGFGRSLRACLPGLKTIQPRKEGSRVRAYRGLDLKPPDLLNPAY